MAASAAKDELARMTDDVHSLDLSGGAGKDDGKELEYCFIDKWSDDVARHLEEAFGSSKVVAFDAEGVDLSRVGRLSLLQLSSADTDTVFLLDVLDALKKKNLHTLPIVAWVKELLENPDVVKVVHDCRMDTDALEHHLNISMVNVHDTQCWHEALTGNADINLNEVLSCNNLSPHLHRDKGMYQRDPAIWATRPLTPELMALAAGDVHSLLDLRDKQMKHASDREVQRAQKATMDKLNFAKEAEVEVVRVMNPGKFIGRRGSTLRALQSSTGTLIYGIGRRADQKFMVYYTSPSGLAEVKRCARA